MKATNTARDWSFAFASALGWFAISGQSRLKRLCFGHANQQAALAAVQAHTRCPEKNLPNWARAWRSLFQAYANGEQVDLGEIPLEMPDGTPFQQAVLLACMEIPWGSTVTYGQLATHAGYPGAARATGSVMAKNRLPLVIPCHRVVACGGKLGKYSAVGGTALKERLLKLESNAGKSARRSLQTA